MKNTIADNQSSAHGSLCLRARQDILFSEVQGGVLVQWGDRGFIVKGKSAYKWVANLLPKLDGSVSLAELVSELDDQRASLVEQLVGSLVSRGAVRETPKSDKITQAGLDGQLAYIAHYAMDPVAGLKALQACSVTVHGEGHVAEACAAGLIANGFTQIWCSGTVASALMVVREIERAKINGRVAVKVGPGASESNKMELAIYADLALSPNDLLSKLHESVSAGKIAIPLILDCSRALIGPVISNESVGLTYDAWERYLAAADPETEAAFRRRWLRGDSQLPVPGSRLSRSLLGNLLAFEAFKHVSGIGAETEQGLVIFDLETTIGVAEDIVPLPHALATHDALNVPTTNLWQEMHTADDAERSTGGNSAETTSGRKSEWKNLISHYTGIVSDYADYEIVQSPLKIGCLRYANPWSVSDRRVVWGWSRDSLAMAREEAFLKLAEIYSIDAAAHLMPNLIKGFYARSGKPLEMSKELLMEYSNSSKVDLTVSGWNLREAYMRAMSRLYSVTALRKVSEGKSETAFRFEFDMSDESTSFLVGVAKQYGLKVSGVAHVHRTGRVSVIVNGYCSGTDNAVKLDKTSVATLDDPNRSAAEALTEMLAHVQASNDIDLRSDTDESVKVPGEVLSRVQENSDFRAFASDKLNHLSRICADSSLERVAIFPMTPEDIWTRAGVSVLRVIGLPDDEN